MMMTLRESKAKLSYLVDLASRGEEVLITVRGRVKARLTSAEGPVARTDKLHWVAELREFQKSIEGSAAPRLTVEQILAEDRADRL
jgi:prevent-host-death family protein